MKLLILILMGGLMMTQANIPPTKIEPIYPAEVAEVVKELRVIEIKKRTGSPFFLATLFIPEMLWTTRMPDLDEVLDNYVKYKAGNATRVFLFPSSWDKKYNEWATDIFLRDEDGKFILPNPDEADKYITASCINPKWENQVIERIQKVVRRKIMLILSLWDNCSFHLKSPGFWSENFLNPENSNTNTSDDNHAYCKYTSYSSVYKRMRNTGEVVEALTRYMLNAIYENLTLKERKYIAIETCNEGRSGIAWHMRMKEIIDETWKYEDKNEMPRWRRFTSAEGDVPLSIGKDFTPVIHQIGNMEQYNGRVPLGYRCGISTDGWKEGDRHFPTPIPVERAIKLLKRAYRDGLVSFEILHGHRNLDQRPPKTPNNTTKNKYYYDHSGMRWTEMEEIARTLRRLTK